MKKNYSVSNFLLVKNLINLDIVIPWYKKIQGSIGKIYLGDNTGPVTIKKYKT